MKKLHEYKKRGSTTLLRLAVYVMAIFVLAFCIFSAPAITDGKEGVGHLLPFVYIASIPFFYALYQTLKLLNYIDSNKAFSVKSVDSLKRIKYSGLTISGIYVLLLPFLMQTAQKEDAPGLFAIGLIIVGGAFVISIAAGVLQKLVQAAVDLKSENELTV